MFPKMILPSDSNNTVTKALEEIAKQIATSSRDCKELIKLIETFNVKAKGNDVIATQSSLVKIAEKLKKIQNQYNQAQIDNVFSGLTSWVQLEKESLKTKYDQYCEEYTQTLSRRFEENGFLLEGHFPLLTVRNAKIKVETSKMKVSVVYGGDEERIAEVQGLNSEETVSIVRNFYQYLEKRNLKDELESIFKSYVNVVRKENADMESWVPIMKVINEYVMLQNSLERNREFYINPNVSSFKAPGPYSTRILFSYTLYRIMQSDLIHDNKYRLNKRTATHGAAGKWEEHLWLPINDNEVQGENAMYLNFSEAN